MFSTRRSIFLAVLVLGTFFAGYWYRGRNPGSPAADPAGRKILYWHDPMHPAYKSDKPGIAPDCGMQLEPVYADGGGSENVPSRQIPGAIMISADRQQVMGVRIGRAERLSPNQTVRFLGRVAADETQIYRLVSTTEGWVREISSYAVGSIVQKDELLATYFAREILTPQSAYIYALDTRDRRSVPGVSADQTSMVANQVRSAEDNLINLGMSQTQIHELARTRTASSLMEVRAPAVGIILARNVARNLRIDRNAELYRMADISHVWVIADVYERDAKLIQLGAHAQVRYQDHLMPAETATTLPVFDPASRTLKVRLELNNPGYVLRPDMFVDVNFPVRLPASVAVPAEAVIDTGLRKRVFVDRGNGFFESREVETGWMFGDKIQIVKGLMEGEQIVVSGTFLIDSESRMKAAAAGITGTPIKDPVCGMDVDETKSRIAGRTSIFSGTTYYFCSDMCKQEFEKNPRQYVK
jgi:membrane fusion protein, copper/silver efflux system